MSFSKIGIKTVLKLSMYYNKNDFAHFYLLDLFIVYFDRCSQPHLVRQDLTLVLVRLVYFPSFFYIFVPILFHVCLILFCLIWRLWCHVDLNVSYS